VRTTALILVVGIIVAMPPTATRLIIPVTISVAIPLVVPMAIPMAVTVSLPTMPVAIPVVRGMAPIMGVVLAVMPALVFSMMLAMGHIAIVVVIVARYRAIIVSIFAFVNDRTDNRDCSDTSQNFGDIVIVSAGRGRCDTSDCNGRSHD